MKLTLLKDSPTRGEVEFSIAPGEPIPEKLLREVLGEYQASVMLVGWPGMGNVGIGAIDYFRRKLDAIPFAELDVSDYFTADSVVVEDGIASLPEVPDHTFSFIRESNLVIFQSELQLGGKPGILLMERILDLAESLGVERIFTGAASPAAVSHKDSAQVYGVANQPELRDELIPFDVEIIQEDVILGLNGLLLGYAAKRDIAAACLLGTVPPYAGGMPNPKASREIVHVLSRYMDLQVDMDEMDVAVEKIEETMASFEDQIQMVFMNMEKDEMEEEGVDQIAEDKVPQHVMARIEQLFWEVTNERSKEKALVLKKVLDRWNLYQFYEDRFLNLFRQESEGGGL